MSVTPPRLAVGMPENKPVFDQECNHPESIPRDAQGRRARILAAGLLASEGWKLAAETGMRPASIAGDGSPGPDVSLSHSGGWVAAAMSVNGRVGIDIETSGRPRNYAAMAEAYLSAEENRRVAKEGEDAFLAFWTLREAVAKLGDEGLAAALALDGARIIDGRNGWCASGSWVAAHRQMGGVHLAAAWAPSPPCPEAGHLLRAAMESLASICTHT